MNKENVLKAISIMERAGDSISMIEYQTRNTGIKYSKTEEELHTCGNTACFAGYVAVSKEFRESGGSIDESLGMPIINNRIGVHAIEYWLDISETLAYSLVFGDRETRLYFSNFYNKPWLEVNANDVNEKLNLILKGKLK